MVRQPAWAAGAALLLVMAAMAPSAARAYEFDMVFQTKCVMEEVNENEEVSGRFNAFQRDQPDQPVTIDVRFEDPAGALVFERHGSAEGEFQFQSSGEGEYKLCFTARDYHTAQGTRIRMQWNTGAAAHDWEAVAKKENLNVIQTELRRLESVVHTMHLELQNIRRKEERMRDINEATNNRVAWFNVLAALVCCGFCGWQLWYLNKFFKRKKVL
ncbi:transmembrane emp24 domain-containing p24delta4-like [Micractinium conductrix]|uniref:Transmembrane emp24 domain-containing p24delta4-like n=1 Tax=Micractinium conductrix TaxID=554055 RepID=A0A2P6VCI1_9CHLO|nr:transmembrane emp24 domain-containing p24delta4-like [Micractinium conductrix]|eukprot:PSC71761.1 transmembrane emp24 domain-containing p24delta4-like [Micractinium conductrix]